MKKKLILSNYDYSRPLTKEEKHEVLRFIEFETGLFIAHKMKSGKYRTYCQKCGTYETVTASEYKQIQASNLCNRCMHQVKMSRDTIHTSKRMWYVSKLIRNEEYGYAGLVKMEFGKKPRLVICKQVLYVNWEEGFAVRNGVVKNMGWSLCFTGNDEWRQCTQDYAGYFYDMRKDMQALTKRQYYEQLGPMELMKTNQAEICKRNLLNHNQIKYMLKFDLKSYDDIYKYRGYMKQNTMLYSNVSGTLNVYYLDYLKRNKIPLSDFLDYQAQCLRLNIKLDKPKDFQEKHQELTMLEQQDFKKDIEKKIKRRYKKLVENSGKFKDVEILPFRNRSQIITYGDRLHNCLRTYVEDYANARTDIYYIEESSKLVGALEIKGEYLVQARGKFNEKITKEQRKAVIKWCKKRGYAYENR